jgi:hypothetical protein
MAIDRLQRLGKNMNCRHCDGEITAHDSGIGKIDECRVCATDVERYVGHMVWDHKTAPALEVHANAKSLAALRDGRERTGGQLVYEVKDRARRREGDVSSVDGISLSPYVRPEPMQLHVESEVLPAIAMRQGSGKTVATYSRDLLEKAAKGDMNILCHLKDTKLKLAKAASRLQLNNVAGWSITVWQDNQGYYVVPKRSVTRSVLDDETTRLLGFRTSNFSPF